MEITSWVRRGQQNMRKPRTCKFVHFPLSSRSTLRQVEELLTEPSFLVGNLSVLEFSHPEIFHAVFCNLAGEFKL